MSATGGNDHAEDRLADTCSSWTIHASRINNRSMRYISSTIIRGLDMISRVAYEKAASWLGGVTRWSRSGALAHTITAACPYFDVGEVQIVCNSSASLQGHDAFECLTSPQRWRVNHGGHRPMDMKTYGGSTGEAEGALKDPSALLCHLRWALIRGRS